MKISAESSPLGAGDSLAAATVLLHQESSRSTAISVDINPDPAGQALAINNVNNSMNNNNSSNQQSLEVDREGGGGGRQVPKVADNDHDEYKVPHRSYWQIFLLFLWFGFNAWGGPM